MARGGCPGEAGGGADAPVEGPVQRRLLWALLVLLLLQWLWFVQAAAPTVQPTDALAYQAGQELLERGTHPYDEAALVALSEERGESLLPFLYPPPFLTLFRPLLGTRWRAVAGFRVLSLAGVGLFAAAGWRLLRALPARVRARRWLLALWAASAALPTIEGCFYLNLNMPVLGLAAAIAVGGRVWPRRAALASGVLAAIKIVPGLMVLPLLLGRGGVKRAGWAVASGAGLGLASLWWPGVGVWRAFVSVLPELAGGAARRAGFSWVTLANASLQASLWPLGMEPARAAQRGLAVGLLLAVCGVLWRQRAWLGRPGWRGLWLSTLPLLLLVQATPFGWPHLSLGLSLPALGAIAQLTDRPAGRGGGVGLVVLLASLLVAQDHLLRELLLPLRFLPSLLVCLQVLWWAGWMESE